MTTTMSSTAAAVVLGVEPLTPRSRTYSLFRQNYLESGYNNTFTDSQLTALVGFLEGDGSLTGTTSTMTPQLAITQKEKTVLLIIQAMLGFGSVVPRGDYYAFVVSNRGNCYLLLLLLNGNLSIEKVVHRILR